MATPATAVARPYDTLRAFETALASYETLTTTDMVSRAAAALDNVIRNWKGDNPIDSLVAAIGVTRGTAYHWRTMKRHVSPTQIYRICLFYCAPTPPADPDELDQLPAEIHDDAGQLFDLFYSENQRDAVNWLIENRPRFFDWSAHPAAA